MPSHKSLPGGAGGKDPACQCRRQRHQFSAWVGKIPWRWAWQPTPVFLPGKSHGQRSQVATVHGVAESWTRQMTNCAHREGSTGTGDGEGKWLQEQRQIERLGRCLPYCVLTSRLTDGPKRLLQVGASNNCKTFAPVTDR